MGATLGSKQIAKRYFSCVSGYGSVIQSASKGRAPIPSESEGSDQNSSRQPTFLTSAALLSVGGLLSKVLGIARQWLMAAMFGASAATDSWLMASVIPTAMFEIIGGGFAMVLVPMLAGRQGSDADAADGSVQLFLDEIFTWTVVVSLLLTALLEMFTPQVVHVIAPGFQERFPLTVVLLRMILPAGLAFALGNFINAILQANRVYHTVAATPIIINVIRIATMVTFGVWWHIVGVALGFVLANAVQLIYLTVALARQRIRLHWRLTVRHAWTREYLSKAGPTFLSHSVRFGSTFVDRVFASTLVAGRIAAINFAQVLAQMPLTLALNPVVTPLFSDLAQQFNQYGRNREFHALVQRIYEMSLVVAAPAVVGLLLWRMPVVVLLYQHGRFNRAASILTAHLVLYWVLGLPIEVLGIAGSRILLAQHQVRGATTAALGAMACNIIGDYLLIRRMGSTGLVIATGIAAVVRVLIQMVWLLCLRTSPGPTRARFWLGWGAGMVIFSAFMEGGYQAAIGLGWDTGIWLAAAMGLSMAAALAGYGAVLIRTGVVSVARMMRGPFKRLGARS